MQDSTAGSPIPPSERVLIPIKRPPLWSPGLMIFGFLTGSFILSSAYDIVPRLMHKRHLTEEGLASAGLAILALIIFATVMGKRLLVRLKTLPPITFEDDHVLLPMGGEALHATKLPYADIMAVNEGGQPPRRHYFIESTKHMYHLAQEMFVDLDGPERFFMELRRRILALPQGGGLLEQTEQRRRAAMQAMKVNPVATQAILGCIAVFFLNTALKGALDDHFGLLRWGANAAALVRHGDYYRLFAANFLHLGWLHVLMNGLALYYLGTLLERLLGWARFLIIYLTSGFVAMLASAMTAGALMSMGASGAIFGLLGGFAVVSWRLRAQLPLALRQTPRWWLTIFAVNALLPVFWPIVDLSAHIGGFITGVAVTALLVAFRRTLPPPANLLTQVVAVALIAVYSAALVTAVVHAARTDAEGEAAYADLLLHDPSTDPNLLNVLAWVLGAMITDPTPEQLRLADTCATEAVRRDPTIPEYHDTLAHVAYRLKDMPRALAAEHRALTMDSERGFYAQQMTRFLTAPARSAQDTQVPYALALTVHDDHLQLDAKGPIPDGGSLYFLVFKGEHPHALTQVKLGKDAKPPFKAPDDFPFETSWTTKIEWWTPDAEGSEASDVKWHVWMLPEEDD